MKVRVTGILVENDKLLLLDQDVNESRSWSLPGGKLEENETLEAALVREMREETGLIVEVKELLYVADYITDKTHVLHTTFRVEMKGGQLGDTIEGLDTNPIRKVAFVPLSDLEDYGFSKVFKQLALDGFPNKGSYVGPKSNTGL